MLLADHPGRALLVSALLTGLLGYAARGVTSHYEVEDFFAEDTDERRVYDRYQARFGRDDRAALMIVEGPSALTPADMTVIADAVAAIEGRPGIEKVVAPTNVSMPRRDSDGVVRLQLAMPPAVLRGDDAKRWAEVMDELVRPPHVGQVLSADRRVGVIAAVIDPGYLSNADRTALTRFLETVADEVRGDGRTVRLAGYPVHRVYLSEHISGESRRLTPFVLLVVALILGLLFRSVVAVAVPLLVAGVSVVWTMGLMRLLGVSTNILAPALFILVALVAVTDCVHLLAAWRAELRRGTERREAGSAALRHLLRPCLLTSVTTAAVFVGLRLTGVPLIAEFGLAVGIGVIAAFLAAMLIAPGLLWAWSLTSWPIDAGRGRIDAALRRLDRLIQAHPGRVLAATIAATAVCLLATARVEINSPLLADLDPDHPVQVTNAFVEARLGGLIPLDVVLDLPSGAVATAYAADRMADIERLGQKLAELPGVKSVTSPTDPLRRLQPLLKRVGADDALGLMPTALLLAPEHVDTWVHADSHTMRIRLRLENLDTNDALALFERIRSAVADELGENATITGQGYLGQLLNRRLVDHFGRSFLIGLLLVLLAIMVTLRNPRHPLVALYPNLLPLIVVGGLMGVLGIELRYTSALVLSVAFGLAVDDTIHTLAQLYAHRGRLNPIGEAMRAAGPGIVCTSAVLAAGLSVLTFSHFVPNQVLGLLLSVTVIAALWGDLVLLPALLRLLERRRPSAGGAPPLRPVLARVAQLDEPSRDQMFALMDAGYAGMERERFEADLSRKQWVILLRVHEVGPIRGFSTIRVQDVDGVRILFSGDTVVAPEYWGQKALQTGFSLFTLRLRLQTLGRLYWVLTSKGYKTYLLLTRNFGRHWPRRGVPFPAALLPLRHAMGEQLFGDAYDPGAGVARLQGRREHVRTDIAAITERDLEDPDIRFFVEANPGHADGDELVCIAELRYRTPFRVYGRALFKRLLRLTVRRSRRTPSA